MAMLAGPARLTPNAIIASRMEARERLRRQEIEAGKPSQSSNGQWDGDSSLVLPLAGLSGGGWLLQSGQLRSNSRQ